MDRTGNSIAEGLGAPRPDAPARAWRGRWTGHARGGSEAPAGFLAGAALASLPSGAGPGSLALGGLAGAILAVAVSRGESPGDGSLRAGALDGRDPLERVAPWLILLGLLPVATLPVAPGADMAMHVALARALGQGAAEMSPAWPEVTALVYPRGFAGLVALLAPLGLARAGLLAAGLAFVVYARGTAVVFRATGVPRPWTVAALALFLAKAPQEAFGWGGNATVLALGLGFQAAAGVGVPGGPARAALLLAGAAAIHPMGAAAGLVAVLALAAKARAPVAALAALVGAGSVVGLVAAAGPGLSPEERRWLVDWSREVEGLLTGTAWTSPRETWPAVPRALGWAWTAAVSAAALLLLARGHLAPVGRAAAGLLLVGAVMAALRLPPLEGLVYPARLAPLLALASAPLLGQALVAIPARPARLAALLLLAVAAPLHARWYQGAAPMATHADLQVLECLARRTPPGAVVAGAYGDATQWVPALTGRRITAPHRHVSLLDETAGPLRRLRPTHQLVGERLRYPPAFPAPEVPPPPAGPPLCQSGAARLWALAP